MSRPLSILLAVSCLIAVTSIARAESPGEQGELGEPVTTNVLGSFQTPSKNIACQFFTDNGQGVLRCDVMNLETRPRRPADCELEWGNAFEMSAKGAAGRICAGDTIMDPSLPVLAYGEVWQRAGFTCRSEQTGLTCFNAMQRGFSLARAEQKVF